MSCSFKSCSLALKVLLRRLLLSRNALRGIVGGKNREFSFARNLLLFDVSFVSLSAVRNKLLLQFDFFY